MCIKEILTLLVIWLKAGLLPAPLFYQLVRAVLASWEVVW